MRIVLTHCSLIIKDPSLKSNVSSNQKNELSKKCNLFAQKKQAMIDKRSFLTDNENRYQLKIKELHNETFKKDGPNWYNLSSWFILTRSLW
ncbi:hypothetical protein DKB98_02280 [Enterococcus faecalis]|nr:hypothetical protein [Listeria monocytogenes]MBO6323920.1 hypothetical protein [Enterococcus faecalis]EAK8886445.1 hypothetical protein [Listeria monocytogenes]PWI83642.1 hypothetical protein DKC02_07410 [Enterococcus faecalis]PWI86736.1 hypothetical protein DKC03_10875 [Enterococcus faecalis]